MPISTSELADLKGRDPRLHSILKKIVEQVNLVQRSTGVAPPNQLPVPPTLGGIAVSAENGFFDVALTDKQVEQPGIVYFVETAATANFPDTATHTYGPFVGRNIRMGIGNLTLFWRAYSMYQGSGVRSPYVVFGGTNTPASVVGGGAAAPPLSPAQGSGTSQTPGHGFGASPRSLSPRIPGPLTP